MPQIKHYGKVSNNQIIWKRKDLLEAEKRILEGKSFYVTFTEISKESTTAQDGFYFGGIIKGECMQSNAFSGWTAKEIHEYLLKSLRPMPIIKNNKLIWKHEDYNDFKRTEKATYIEQVMALLSSEHGIEVKEPKYYKEQKYGKIIK